MNCCDYDCNQGRNCPARKASPCKHCHGLGYDASGYPCTCVTPARVAKIGRKEHGREPLRGAPWRRHLKDLAAAMLLVLTVMLVSAVTVALIPKNPGVNCAALIAQWHPDIPAHIRAKCMKEKA